MTDTTQTAEYAHALELAVGDAGLLRQVAQKLHYNESMHMHDDIESKDPCRYCWLRAGRALAAAREQLSVTLQTNQRRADRDNILEIAEYETDERVEQGLRSAANLIDPDEG